MDSESFDRLSVGVHRLQRQVSRRGALRLVLGGSAVAVGGVTGDEAEARRGRNRRNRDRFCWFGRCWGNGGKNKNRCGGCPSGWRCRTQAHVSVCVPKNFTNCCGNICYSPGYTCCGTGLCSGGWKCCHGSGIHTCIPKGWDCNDFFRQEAGITTASGEAIPSADPISPADVPTKDKFEIEEK
jgi:hypothetical protein